MKKAFYLLIIPLLISSNMYGQFLTNDSNLLAINSVQSLRIVELFADSTCLHQKMDYDVHGNEIKYDLLRLDHYYKSVYDEYHHKVEELKVDRNDEKRVDTTYFQYDKHGSMVKETSVYYYGEDRSEFVMQYNYTYNDSGKVLKKCQLIEEEGGELEEILLNEYVYNKRGDLEKILQYMDDEVATTEFFQYNEDSLLVRKDVDDPSWFERVNMMKIKERPNIQDQYTSYVYNDSRQIMEVYQYFSDPCLSMDNYYAYRYTYLPNGLIEGIEVWEERESLVSKVRFEYETLEEKE